MKLRRRVVLLLSSALGLGYLPRAPGTWGTLAALPIWWLIADLPWWQAGLITVGVAGGAIWVADAAERLYGAHDVQRIVIDEVAGMLVTAFLVPFRWPEVLVAFVLFRLFDMTKPPPIRQLDQKVQGGFGVVLDDLAAGVLASLLLHGARWLLGGWW